MRVGEKHTVHIPERLRVDARPRIGQTGYKVGAIEITDGGQQPHLDRLVQAEAALRLEILLVEPAHAAEIEAEVEPELCGAVLQQDLVPTDGLYAVVARYAGHRSPSRPVVCWTTLSPSEPCLPFPTGYARIASASCLDSTPRSTHR